MLARQNDSGDVSFGIDSTIIPVEAWDAGGDNHYQVEGVLTYKGEPVAGAVLQTNIYRLPTATAEDGSYLLKGDKTLLQRQLLSVAHLDNATVAGAELDEATKAALEGASVVVESAFDLEVEPVTAAADTAGTVLTGSMMFKDSEHPAPAVQLWGYVLSGIVTDANGDPLANANVSIRDDEGETWSLSTITDETGEYSLRFYPLGGGYQVRVAQGNQAFESDVEAVFNPETSAKMDVIVHTDMGMAVGTGPEFAWEITDVPGAEYVGYLTGIAVDNAPVPDAEVTFPDEEGTFTVTLPSLPAGTKLSFFQERIRVFANEPLTPGGVVPAELIPAELAEQIPMNLEPTITIE